MTTSRAVSIHGANPSDYYAVDRRLACRLEAEWSDLLLAGGFEPELVGARRIGLSEYLVPPTYYRQAATWLASVLPDHRPRRSVDIGAGLGRFVVEVLRACPELESAHYVEPSESLFSWGARILSNAQRTPDRMPFLKGIGDVEWYDGALSPIEAGVRRKLTLVHGTVDSSELQRSTFDLVTLMNVLDQCAYPSEVARQSLALVAPDGYALMSCTYQFQERFYVDDSTVFQSLHDLFSAEKWTMAAETELVYVAPMAERHRNVFWSHHVLYRRSA